jgi:hypothetical protein
MFRNLFNYLSSEPSHVFSIDHIPVICKKPASSFIKKKKMPFFQFNATKFCFCSAILLSQIWCNLENILNFVNLNMKLTLSMYNLHCPNSVLTCILLSFSRPLWCTCSACPEKQMLTVVSRAVHSLPLLCHLAMSKVDMTPMQSTADQVS